MQGMAPIEPQAGRGAAGVEPPLTRFCVFCRQSVESWQPYPWVTGSSDFLDRLGVVGSNLERFFCPHCRSFDRERHLRLFLERRGIMEPLRGGAVLHLAPEPRLGEFIRSHGVSVYVQGDLSPRDASIQQIDAERLPFPPQATDLVVCNHVLEHVANPKRVFA
jgi:hypothetical protein